jgi:type II secretory ATPase GspE/PulE/Tfp pilus assembly ATPase PilB-like protein
MIEYAEPVDAVITSATATRPSLPFTFAQQHGVLLDADEHGAPVVVYTGQPQVQVLTELRRFLGAAFTLQDVAESDFKRRLTLAYQRSNNEAVQMAEDIGADVDLSRLADEIPESGDLMDTQDDAPIIRLINAILSQAVREQASDIHIETFEDRLSVRYRDGQARYRRKARAAGRQDFSEDCRACGRYPHVHHSLRPRRASGAATAGHSGGTIAATAAGHERAGVGRL